MNWWSETAVLSLPVAGKPYPGDFADRANPGSSNFYYYALDAFEAIGRRRASEFDREPWAYVLADHAILSPTEIDQLMDKWREQVRAVGTSTVVYAKEA